jgi:hypothetical protein
MPLHIAVRKAGKRAIKLAILIAYLCCICSGQVASSDVLPRLGVFPPMPVNVRRGETISQTLTVVVSPGFYISSNKPGEKSPIPLKLTWSGGLLEAKSITYPTPQKVNLSGRDVVAVSGTFGIQTRFQVSRDLVQGESGVMYGNLQYELCSATMCLKPSSTNVYLAVNVN